MSCQLQQHSRGRTLQLILARPIALQLGLLHYLPVSLLTQSSVVARGTTSCHPCVKHPLGSQQPAGLHGREAVVHCTQASMTNAAWAEPGRVKPCICTAFQCPWLPSANKLWFPMIWDLSANSLVVQALNQLPAFPVRLPGLQRLGQRQILPTFPDRHLNGRDKPALSLQQRPAQH